MKRSRNKAKEWTKFKRHANSINITTFIIPNPVTTAETTAAKRKNVGISEKGRIRSTKVCKQNPWPTNQAVSQKILVNFQSCVKCDPLSSGYVSCEQQPIALSLTLYGYFRPLVWQPCGIAVTRVKRWSWLQIMSYHTYCMIMICDFQGYNNKTETTIEMSTILCIPEDRTDCMCQVTIWIQSWLSGHSCG